MFKLIRTFFWLVHIALLVGTLLEARHFLEKLIPYAAAGASRVAAGLCLNEYNAARASPLDVARIFIRKATSRTASESQKVDMQQCLDNPPESAGKAYYTDVMPYKANSD